MNTSPTLEQLWAILHPVAHGQLFEYKQLWDAMLGRCVTPCQVSWLKVGTGVYLMTKTFKNEFMLVATYLLEGSRHSSAHAGLMKDIFFGWLKRGIPDLSALREADKYLTFLQTYIRIEAVNTHNIQGAAELAKAPGLPFDQHDRELFAHEAGTSNRYGFQMGLDDELTSSSINANITKRWADPISVPGPEYIDNCDQFFPVDISVCPTFFFAGYQEKWIRMARASAGVPYLMHMHCPKTGARLNTLKFTSALALMTAYLESFSKHPDLWWYFDEFMRHYLDLGNVNPQPTLDYMRNTVSPSKPVVVAVPIPK
ncbi:hypothetical protein KCU95_g1907, partial [Aureobasidium melanogenum]